MPTDTVNFRSDYLPKEQIHVALMALPAVFRKLLGDCFVTASYGWAAHIHGDLWYKPMKVGTSWMEYFIEDSIDQRIIIPGESDLYFDVAPDRLTLLFCHESDIHLNGTDDDLIRQLMATEPFATIRFHPGKETNKSE